MTTANLERSLRNLQRELEQQTKLEYAHIVISDSKGRYLQQQRRAIANSATDQIIWYCVSGAKIRYTLDWLRRDFERIRARYRKVVAYLWLGTCDLTEKGRQGQISLRQGGDSVPEYIGQKYREIAEFLKRLDCKVVILETPYYSIKYWNTKRGAQPSSNLDDEDKQLKRQVKALNELVDQINSENQALAPKLNVYLVKSRRKRGITEYFTDWALLPDGIHPSPTLAKIWLLKITKYCLRAEGSI